jgi:hypothetical protein
LVVQGAAQVANRQSDSAAASFREALSLDPRARPDPRTGAAATTAFHEVRQQTGFVGFRPPGDTTLSPGDQYRVRLYSSGIHETTVAITTGAGQRVRRLYLGLIVDSLDVRWDGLDSTGAAPLLGPVMLQVVLRPADGTRWTTRLPLTIQATVPDTLPLPLRPTAPVSSRSPTTAVDPSPLPRTAHDPKMLAAGLLTGLAVVALPKLVAADGQGSAARFVLGGTVGLAAIVGFIAPSGSRPPVGRPVLREPERPAIDLEWQRKEQAWQRATDSVRAENQRRRRAVQLRVKAGVPIGPEIDGQ